MAQFHLSGVVLAAGRSTRMGTDKALLRAPDRAGQPMWQRQCAMLTMVGAAEIYLSVRPEQRWAQTGTWKCLGDAPHAAALNATAPAAATGCVTRREVRVAGILHDALPDCGPLVGITAALERAVQASHLAVLAVDLPEMQPAWFARLLGACRAGVGVVGRRDGFFEPLAAVYPRALMWLAWEALAHGHYSLQQLLDRAVEQELMVQHEISADEEPWFRNWNAGPGDGISARGD